MNNKIIASNHDIVFYKKDNGDTNIELLINGETLWVSQKTMAEIFDIDRTVITKHLKNIFIDGELDKIKYVQNLHILQMSERYLINKPLIRRIMNMKNIELSKTANLFQVWIKCIKNI